MTERADTMTTTGRTTPGSNPPRRPPGDLRSARVALAGALFRAARHPAAGAVVAFVLGRFGHRLPLLGARATRDFLVFRHPVPSAADHLLIVPRRRCPTLESLEPARFGEAIALALAHAAALGDPGFERHVLSINGGAFQDVMQAHFHLTGTAGAAAADCHACADAPLLFTGPGATMRARAPGKLDVVLHDVAAMPEAAADAATAILNTVRSFLAARATRPDAYRLDFGPPPCTCPAASWFRLTLRERSASSL
jgi:diadenosine tetraphosphate (Ap4A) HIT family hydrolase